MKYIENKRQNIVAQLFNADYSAHTMSDSSGVRYLNIECTHPHKKKEKKRKYSQKNPSAQRVLIALVSFLRRSVSLETVSQ